MIKNFLAVLVLSLTVAACDSGSTDTPSNANNPAKASTPAASTPTASTEASPSTAPQIKAGDKVKSANGSFSDATVVSVDEKAGKVTIKVAGESKERTVAIADVVKQ